MAEEVNYEQKVVNIMADYISDLTNKDIELIKENMNLHKENCKLKQLLIANGINIPEQEEP